MTAKTCVCLLLEYNLVGLEQRFLILYVHKQEEGVMKQQTPLHASGLLVERKMRWQVNSYCSERDIDDFSMTTEHRR